MELALLIYVINMLPSLDDSLSFLISISLLVSIILGLIFLVNLDERYESETNKEVQRKYVKISGLWFKRFIIASFIMVGFKVFIPSERTAYMMVAGYISQSIAQSEQMGKVLSESGKISNKILTIINNKLDTYVDETMNKVEKVVESKTEKSGKS